MVYDIIMTSQVTDTNETVRSLDKRLDVNIRLQLLTVYWKEVKGHGPGVKETNQEMGYHFTPTCRDK